MVLPVPLRSGGLPEGRAKAQHTAPARSNSNSAVHLATMEQVIPEQVKEGEAERAPVQNLVVLIHREEVQEGEGEEVQLQLHLPSARKAVLPKLATAKQAHRSPAVPLAAPKFQAAQPGHRPHSMLSFLLPQAVAGSFSKDLFSGLPARGLAHPRGPQELECPLPL